MLVPVAFACAFFALPATASYSSPTRAPGGFEDVGSFLGTVQVQGFTASLRFDAAGNAYLTSRLDGFVRIDRETKAMLAFYPGTNSNAQFLDVNKASNIVWVADTNLNVAIAVDASGVPAYELATVRLTNGTAPVGVGADSTGKAWLAASGTSSVVVLKTTGIVKTVALGKGDVPVGVIMDSLDQAWVSLNSSAEVVKVTQKYEKTTYALPRVCGSVRMAVDGSDNVWMSCPAANVVLRVTQKGKVIEVTGFLTPMSVTADPFGYIWVANSGNSSMIRLDASTGAIVDNFDTQQPSTISDIRSAPDNTIWAVLNEIQAVGVYAGSRGSFLQTAAPTTSASPTTATPVTTSSPTTRFPTPPTFSKAPSMTTQSPSTTKSPTAYAPLASLSPVPPTSSPSSSAPTTAVPVISSAPTTSEPAYPSTSPPHSRVPSHKPSAKPSAKSGGGALHALDLAGILGVVVVGMAVVR